MDSSNTPKLTLIRGIPGSGKTTLAKTICAELYEADMWFERFNKGVFDGSKIRRAHAWCQAKAIAALCEGKSVVVANTFTQRWELGPYLDAAKKIGCDVEEIVCHGQFENVHRVPKEKVAEMAARFEA